MSGVTKFLKRVFGKGGKSLEQATETAGVKYVTKMGVLGDRLYDLADMFSKDKSDAQRIHMSAEFWRSALPWLQVRKDQHMFKKVRAFLDNYALYKRIEKTKKQAQENSDGDIHSGVKETYDLVTVRMVNQATMLIALSFREQDIIDARTYVISKPSIYETRPGIPDKKSPESQRMLLERFEEQERVIRDLRRRINNSG